ncbi:hypothetical protein PHSY_003510 [Pseudozyma hubeiensis SY62]|uniref:Uncharacterized protein n=1 Tax=Pseudozyma hubeiensis (strain SY62) TaxID=1305764 RepID=R9P3W6_PSEHS|nr:hypothetical protein PHSY_003510 [Pseudozyma hubeiensis SY62]GAC95932.1 hypothetical protein PHSY_003510 [Pseudozyma hubeiensis SY62]
MLTVYCAAAVAPVAGVGGVDESKGQGERVRSRLQSELLRATAAAAGDPECDLRYTVCAKRASRVRVMDSESVNYRRDEATLAAVAGRWESEIE